MECSEERPPRDLENVDFGQLVHQHVLRSVDEGDLAHVEVVRGARGLGIAIGRGVDDEALVSGYIHVRQTYPLLADWDPSLLRRGDVLLEVDGLSLAGMGEQEVIQLLRCSGERIRLTVCRLPRDLCEVFPGENSVFSPCSEPQQENRVIQVCLRKASGGLGLTLGKEDNTVLGHYIRRVVRDPALSDGRIEAGDRILEINGEDISEMTNSEVVQFIRDQPDVVSLKLYRDAAQTPVLVTSPAAFATPRKQLRSEALQLLGELTRKRSLERSPDPSRRHRPPDTASEAGPFTHPQLDFPAAYRVEPSSGGLLKWRGTELKSAEPMEEDAGVPRHLPSECQTELKIDLKRGWSARLGFSLAQDYHHRTVVSRIYPGSIAETDGRLQVNDVIVKVNDLDVTGLDTKLVIEKMRNIKEKTVTLQVVRPH